MKKGKKEKPKERFIFPTSYFASGDLTCGDPVPLQWHGNG